MKHTLVFLLLASLALVFGVMAWQYRQSNNEENYQRVFEQQYNRGNRTRDDNGDETYHGTRESDIKKYHGDRYATY